MDPEIGRPQPQLKKIRDRLICRNDPPLFPQGIWEAKLSQEIHVGALSPLLKAVLFLWNDDLESAHKVSQSMNSRDGALCHAIMHRREKDFSNSKYWLEKAEGHSVFTKMARMIPKWSPISFVDWCENSLSGTPPYPVELLEKWQALELKLFLDEAISEEVGIQGQ